MNCQNCDFEMPENSKFCPKCGNKVVVSHKEKKESNTTSTIDNISNHLEFLGYKTEIKKAQDKGEKDMLIATHDQHNNFIIFNISPNILMLRINLTTNKKWNDKMSGFINNANKAFNCARVFYELEEGRVMLRFEGVYTGQYSKQLFSHFFELFNNDVDAIFRGGENFNELFIN